jgi:hypothetical protein
MFMPSGFCVFGAKLCVQYVQQTQWKMNATILHPKMIKKLILTSEHYTTTTLATPHNLN